MPKVDKMASSVVTHRHGTPRPVLFADVQRRLPNSMIAPALRGGETLHGVLQFHLDFFGRRQQGLRPGTRRAGRNQGQYQQRNRPRPAAIATDFPRSCNHRAFS